MRLFFTRMDNRAPSRFVRHICVIRDEQELQTVGQAEARFFQCWNGDQADRLAAWKRAKVSLETYETGRADFDTLRKIMALRLAQLEYTEKSRSVIAPGGRVILVTERKPGIEPFEETPDGTH